MEDYLSNHASPVLQTNSLNMEDMWAFDTPSYPTSCSSPFMVTPPCLSLDRNIWALDSHNTSLRRISACQTVLTAPPAALAASPATTLLFLLALAKQRPVRTIWRDGPGMRTMPARHTVLAWSSNYSGMTKTAPFLARTTHDAGHHSFFTWRDAKNVVCHRRPPSRTPPSTHYPGLWRCWNDVGGR